MLLFLTDGMGYFQRPCAGTLAVGEHMQARDIKRLYKSLRLLKELLGLSARAHNQVDTYKRIRHHPAYMLDLAAEKRRVVASAHQAQHLVAAVLQRDMEMWHEALRSAHEVNQFISKQIRFDRGNAIALYSFDFIKSLAQIKESLTGATPEVADINTGDDNFLATLGCHIAGLGDYLLNRS